MRVFLDSNVLVSALATRGLCSDVLRLVLREHELVTAEVVLEEVERALRNKFGMPGEEVERVIVFLRDYHVEPKPPAPSSTSIRDPDDRWVLASAEAAEAEVLVTGDAGFLEAASKVHGLTITTPRGFWDLHR